jgi:ribosomal protein RSM22 (predicted rRNA methylase)
LNIALPAELAAALETLLEGVSRRDLAARAARQSADYRAGGTSAAIADEAGALAYAIARMPATYAAARAVFARVAEAMPDFTPSSLLDIGAGPGTASWAALDAWPSIARGTMLERNGTFRALAGKLSENLAGVEILAGDIGGTIPMADLVVASYVLAELPEDRVAAVATHLWSGAQTLVLVEPGTPQGFARIRAGRAALIAAGAHVIAPCTHDAACPMRSVGESRSDQPSVGESRSDQPSVGESRSDQEKEPDWCHFSQRLPRSRDHKLAKAAQVPFEDERYSYVAATRLPTVRKGARIIAPPLEARPGVTLSLCDDVGLRGETIYRRDKKPFARARRMRWGDLF